MLRIGARLGAPIRDQQGNLLLGAGIQITDEYLCGLFKRGIRTVTVDDRDWKDLTAFSAQGKSKFALPGRTASRTDWNREATREIDRIVEAVNDGDVRPSENPFVPNFQPPKATRYDRGQMGREIAHHEKAVEAASELVNLLSQGKAVTASAVNEISQGLLSRAAEDLDLFVCMGINPLGGDQIFAHSVNTATLAVAIGATLGLDSDSLRDLGTGCLIHDAGMMQVKRDLLESTRILESNEFGEIVKHPIISTELLQKYVGRVPVGVRMVVYQMHERCNGSGYPRGVSSDRIHPLAKIGAVADAYVALVSNRPHRKALLPYFAMKAILDDVKGGLYDPVVVRGLLQTIGLFPVGSFVELDDTRVAKAIRANGPALDRPVVEAWARGRFFEEPTIVDLTDQSVRVIKPLASLG